MFKFKKYYNRVVKLGELQYVKKENIDNATIKITSKEMYRELDDLNGHFRAMQFKRELFLADFWIIFCGNFALFGIMLYFLLLKNTSQLMESSILGKMTNGSFAIVCAVYSVTFLIMQFFIYIRKKFSWFLAAILTIPYWLISPVNVVFTIINIPSAIFLKVLDEGMKEDVGYPHFVRIVPEFRIDISDDAFDYKEMDDAEGSYYNEYDEEAAAKEIVYLNDMDIFDEV